MSVHSGLRIRYGGAAVKTAVEQDRSQYQRFALRLLAQSLLLAAILATVAVRVYGTVGDLVEANNLVNHTHQVKEQVIGTITVLRTTEASQRAYLIGGHASRLADVYITLPQIASRVARLRALVADNPAQTRDAAELAALLQQRADTIDRLLAAFQKGGLPAVRAEPRFALAREQDMLADTIVERMLEREDELLVQRKASSERIALLTRTLTIAAVALCFVVLAFALYLVLREQERRAAKKQRALASTIELANSLESSRRLGDTLNRLSDLGHLLQGCRNLDEAALGLRSAMGNLLPASAGTINLLNASQNLIAPASSWGEPIGGETAFTPDDCWALRLGRAYPEEDAKAALTCRHLQDEGGNDARASLCVPLFAQGSTLGTLVLVRHAGIDRETRHAAVAAAEQVSLAIANLRLQETLRTQSLRDELTGLFNRRYLEVSLARDLTRAIRRSQPLAVLMLDVDHFKRFNDAYGHDGGDALLAQFGALLAALVRTEDVACRYGGEEFTIVMQEADAALALDRAEDIRRHVEAMQISHRRQSLGQVTVSIGIASYPQHGDSPEQLLRRADRALYTAKNNGRNQVCVADRS
jgi:diguanylate cyclase (GGDEF)-like protein